MLLAREMMFGSGDVFSYFACRNCGCLQLSDPPKDLGKYYPETYYSFQPLKLKPLPKRLLKRSLADHALTGRGFWGGLLMRRYGRPEVIPWVQRCGVDRGDRIVDVGCGNGRHLMELLYAGFTDLVGVDPYIERSLQYKGGLTIHKAALRDLDLSADMVMMHHAFEHMADPLQALIDTHRVLRPDHFLVLRIPVADSFAARSYGTDWVQLDAPRHFFLHTQQSIGVLAARTGFVVEDVVYDSTGLQFWGSEQYRRGIPLLDSRSVARDPHNSVFSADELRGFDVRAADLNERGEGDSACFYLRKR